MSRRGMVATAAAAGALVFGLTVAGAADADPVVTSGSGGTPALLQPKVDAFRAQLGTLNPNVSGSAPAGRREINWDGVPDAFASPTNLPFDFFNARSPRGVLFTAVNGAPGNVLVSSTAAGSERFVDVEPSYAGTFTAFSAPRLFASQNAPSGISDPSIDVLFRVPGSSAVASTNAFGAVFAGVSFANRTYLQFYSSEGRNLGLYPAPIGSLSFVGVRYDAGERIGFVRVRAGDSRLGPGLRESVSRDVVAMDDFIYGEPQRLATPAASESFENGLGAFTAEKLRGAPADPTFAIAGDDAHSGSSSAFVPDAGSLTDMTLTSPPVAIRGGGPSALTFYHRISSETDFDGGVVEVSGDGGATWADPAPAQWLENGPAARIGAGFQSALTGRIVFSGASAGFVRSVLDLGPYAGTTIRYRFRFASDISNAGRGWAVDDVGVSTPAPPPVTPPIVPPPGGGPGTPVAPGRLTALSLKPRSFASGKTAKVGYTLSAVASVSFTVTRSTAGRLVRGRCKTPAPRRGKRCVKTATVKRITARGAAGANTLTLSLGRVAPGSYAVKATAGGASKSVTFTVTRARARRGKRR